MAGTARIPHARITGIFGALITRFSVKLLGRVPEPVNVMWHSPRVLKAIMGFSRRAHGWRACSPQLKSLAHMASVGTVGCRFCLDLGYFQARNENLDIEKARQVPVWRSSNAFTDLERDVMEYAEAMSQTPLAVTDEMSARLLKSLGARALVELTAFIAASNMASRNNVALGIRMQGFSDSCGLPPLAERIAA